MPVFSQIQFVAENKIAVQAPAVTLPSLSDHMTLTRTTPFIPAATFTASNDIIITTTSEVAAIVSVYLTGTANTTHPIGFISIDTTIGFSDVDTYMLRLFVNFTSVSSFSLIHDSLSTGTSVDYNNVVTGGQPIYLSKGVPTDPAQVDLPPGSEFWLQYNTGENAFIQVSGNTHVA